MSNNSYENENESKEHGMDITEVDRAAEAVLRRWGWISAVLSGACIAGGLSADHLGPSSALVAGLAAVTAVCLAGIVAMLRATRPVGLVGRIGASPTACVLLLMVVLGIGAPLGQGPARVAVAAQAWGTAGQWAVGAAVMASLAALMLSCWYRITLALVQRAEAEGVSA